MGEIHRRCTIAKHIKAEAVCIPNNIQHVTGLQILVAHFACNKMSLLKMSGPFICGYRLPVRYSDVIISAIGLQITAASMVCSTVQAQFKESIKAQRHWPCEGNSPVNSQRASNAENVSIWWCHHAKKRISPTCLHMSWFITVQVISSHHAENEDKFSQIDFGNQWFLKVSLTRWYSKIVYNLVVVQMWISCSYMPGTYVAMLKFKFKFKFFISPKIQVKLHISITR